MFICVGETIWTAKENSRKQKKKDPDPPSSRCFTPRI